MLPGMSLVGLLPDSWSASWKPSTPLLASALCCIALLSTLTHPWWYTLKDWPQTEPQTSFLSRLTRKAVISIFTQPVNVGLLSAKSSSGVKLKVFALLNLLIEQFEGEQRMKWRNVLSLGAAIKDEAKFLRKFGGRGTKRHLIPS